ncbi:thiazole biosynthesis protein ThiH [Halobacteroides halobius DSM 5150]|uniref:Thiazole biosynthesis protein ThiH n=1 Tax=Halobacteroides halobius (strain ATCC 35273 / DSM 5150 / MD-1) TaxID=748449 RepID=L0KAZ2_HALHC|nr:2-iminoacetate synthase ThiH [Halobacteroides halobius]AGB41253.1 thiazole biosynthesis protein ThiH [Halobacteroides halobius DSM 5150]
MSYYNKYTKFKDIDFNNFFKQVTAKDVKKVLTKEKLAKEDFLTLLAPVASNYLEELAQRAHKLTIQHFGKIVSLYTPIYITDHCVNQCSYCGFNVTNNFKRSKLSLKEVEKEAQVIAKKGFKNLLILTGESRKHASISYLKKVIKVLKNYFPSLAIEIYPLTTEGYKELIATGIDGLTIYQEVYDQQIYDKVHLKGPKKNYHFRLDAPERGCQAGMRKVNIGALLGLNNWREEAFFTGLHAYYLQNKYLETQIGLSLPRLRPHLGSFQPNSIVNDRNLVQIMLAFRLFLPRVGINLSTRESAQLRDNLLPLGVTKLSAESSTAVGGYTSSNNEKQFDISDKRKINTVKQVLLNKGYQPVFKSWQRI